MTLTEFLLARIAEDEYWAKEADKVTDKVEDGWQDVTQPITHAMTQARPQEQWAKRYGHAYEHISRHDPARALSECDAKRRIVEDLALSYIAERRRLMGGQPSWSDEHPDLLLLLALPYADHPDWREEWRP